MKKYILPILLFVLSAYLAYSFFSPALPTYDPHQDVFYTDFIQDIRSRAVSEVIIDGNEVFGKRQNGTRFRTYNPNDARLIDELLEYGVKIRVERPQMQPLWMQILISWLPMVLLIGVIVFFMRRQQTGSNGQMSFGKSRAKLMTEDQVKVR
ncbi:MAG: cell division protein FtsH, partial [Methylococcaceae bacterium]|nr:cell division protein FtsH [Methylococcaceae bacterium]